MRYLAQLRNFLCTEGHRSVSHGRICCGAGYCLLIQFSSLFMQKRYYYRYDQEACSYVLVEPRRKKSVFLLSVVATSAILMVGALALDLTIKSPEELALLEENKVLREQLERVDLQFEEFAEQISNFSENEQDMFRILLEAEPISDDVRWQVGVGGADTYEEYDRFSTSTARLMRHTSQELDRIGRLIKFQNESQRELIPLAVANAEALRQRPAIMPTEGRVTSQFGMRLHPLLGFRKHHPGIDITARVGTPVYATGAGVVVEVARKRTGYGSYIEIDHPAAGYKTLYAHLSRFADGVRKGKRVERGDLIGYTGNTGLSVAPHLHYEVHNRKDQRLDPLPFIAPSMTPQRYQALVADAGRIMKALDY